MVMAEKGGTKILAIVTIIIVLISILLAGCIGDDEDDVGFHYLYYEVELETNSEANILFPIPINDITKGINRESNISKLVDDIRILSGTGSYKIELTIYGWAINITFLNKMHLKATAKIYDEDMEKYSSYFFNDISMESKSERGFYYFFSSNNDVKIKNFECYLEHVGSLDDSRDVSYKFENYQLSIGWQKIDLRWRNI
jgi:hypothetical protein